MNNVSMDFLSGAGEILAAVSGSSIDSSSFSGVKFSDMLKAANSDIPTTKIINEKASADIPDTKDIVSFNEQFSQLYQKISGSSQDVKDTFKDFINYISQMINSKTTDNMDMNFLTEYAVYNLCDNSDINLDDPFMFSLLNAPSQSSQLKYTELYDFETSYVVIDNNATDETMELLEEMAGLIDSSLAEDDADLDALVENLKGCVKSAYDDDEALEESQMLNMLAMLADALIISQGNAENVADPQIAENVKSVMMGISADADKIYSDYHSDYPSDSPVDLELGIPDVKYYDVKSYESAEDTKDVSYNGFNSVNLKISDVSSQVDNINAKSDDEDSNTGRNYKSNAEALNLAAEGEAPVINIFQANAVAVPDKAEVAKYIDSIEDQVTEKISSKLLENDGKDGVTEMTIILKPEKLGEIAVRIVSDKGAVQIMLSAQNQAVGNAMNDRIASLTEGLKQQEVDIKSVNIINPTEAGSQMGLDFTNQGFNRRDDNSSDKTSDNDKRASSITIRTINAGDEIVDIHEIINTKEARLWAKA